MIVHRITHYVKQGRVPEFLGLMKSNPDSVLTQLLKRTYTPYKDPETSVVVHELEFEEEAELDKTWKAWWTDPETSAFMEEINNLVKRASNEYWTLEE